MESDGISRVIDFLAKRPELDQCGVEMSFLQKIIPWKFVCQFIQIVPYSWNVHICVKAQRSPLSTNFEPCIYIYRLHRTKLQTKVYIILYLRYSVYSVCTWNKTLLFDVHTLNPSLECWNTYNTYIQSIKILLLVHQMQNNFWYPLKMVIFSILRYCSL